MTEHQLNFETVKILQDLLNVGDDLASNLEQISDEHGPIIEKWDNKIKLLLQDFEKAGITFVI